MMEWSQEIAIDMRKAGQAWDFIGRFFGVSGDTVHVRLDPIYAEKRRGNVNANRRQRPSVTMPSQSYHRGPFMTPHGMAYQKMKHGQVISLPFVSILSREG